MSSTIIGIGIGVIATIGIASLRNVYNKKSFYKKGRQNVDTQNKKNNNDDFPGPMAGFWGSSG